MIRFQVLGAPDLHDTSGGARKSAVTGAKRLALLAYLALESRRGVTRRDRLVGLLWPESSQKRARNALSNLLYQVRRALGQDLITSRGREGLGLADDVLWCDAVAFELAVEEGRLDEALDLYRGDLLEGFYVPGASAEFDHWLDSERVRLRALAADAARRRSDAAFKAGNREEAIRVARWLRRRMPGDEPVVRRLMTLLSRAGDRAGALREYDSLSKHLETEFGVKPSAETQRLAEGLRGGDGSAASVGQPVHRIAVLPFKNLSGTPDGEPFAAGLHDDLLTELSRVPILRVIARTSVLRYRESELSVVEIARELGVGTVVEGAVRTAGGRIRVNVQVIDARDSSHRWAERFDRELSTETIFAIQMELAERIAAAVRADLTEGGRQRPASPPTGDLQAYRLYVKGRGYLDQRTEVGILKAIAFFERAVDLDPSYSLAWTGLSDAVVLLHDYGFGHDAHELTMADEAVARALELDPRLAEAHASLGLVHSIRRRGTESLKALTRSVELRPGYADAHNWLSWNRLVFGIREQALVDARRAVDLDPAAPEPVSNLALSLLANGYVDDAAAVARRVTNLQPDWTTGLFYEALAQYELGRFEEAAGLLHGLTVEWVGNGPRAALAVACAAAGDTSAALVLLDDLEGAADPFSVGLIRLALGQKDPAFDQFRRIERWTYWPTLAIHHFFPGVLAPLRADPLYETLKAELAAAWGLEEAPTE